MVVHGTVQAVPVFGSNGSSRERLCYYSTFLTEGTVPVPVSLPEKRFRRFRFRFRFLGHGSDGFGFRFWFGPGPSCSHWETQTDSVNVLALGGGFCSGEIFIQGRFVYLQLECFAYSWASLLTIHSGAYSRHFPTVSKKRTSILSRKTPTVSKKLPNTTVTVSPEAQL